MKNNKIKVLYIAGSGRSGSTIIDNIMGQVDGFFSAGELRFLWERSLIENRLCGCGIAFRDCELWNDVFVKAFHGMDNIDQHEMANVYSKMSRTHHLLLPLVPGMEKRLKSNLGNYLSNIEQLYHSIQGVTNCKVIIDSSKVPLYGYLLSMIPTIDLYVLHLIRDPRAVVYSWSRNRLYEPNTINKIIYMDKHNLVKVTMFWNIVNMMSEQFCNKVSRYITMKYESFIQKPEESIRLILNLLYEQRTHIPFLDGNVVSLKPNHCTSGNPSRFKTGTVKLKNDNEWQKKISMAKKFRLLH